MPNMSDYRVDVSDVRMHRKTFDICVSQNGDMRHGKRVVARRAVDGYTFDYAGRAYGVHKTLRSYGNGCYWVVTDLASGLQICASNTRAHAVEDFASFYHLKTLRAVDMPSYRTLVDEFAAAAPYVEG